jgi:hypothetical protein
VTSPIPKPIAPKSSTFTDQVATATSFSDLQRFFQPAILRISKHSPPVLDKDITEGQLLLDKTALRIYTVVDNTLRYWSLT